jgi:hypothetical protein
MIHKRTPLNKILVTSIVISTILSSCSTTEQPPTVSAMQPTMYPIQSISEYFPLKGGAYWVYEGNVRWTTADSSAVTEEEVTWKMEVRRAIQRNDIVGYEMLGAPWDLAWYKEGQGPSEYGIIQAGGKFFLTSNDVVRRLMDESDFLGSLVDENSIFLDVPLIPGKKFCDIDSLTRSDGMYCWIVGEASQVTVTNIKGVTASDTIFEFPIYNGTLPDHSILHFIPGVGISGYEYHHHGTVSDAEVRLIEYYSGE